ncbi:GpE family phage tail protein [Martelella alba]|uniref:GpE family phage tail protein n=1 Tax=Martelella alba TaxID=2590451 RepID=A0ABY2SJV9_9HYPH|nr:GpE family phage tail protein [Martelella alba]TKI04919.1 GpE family phage tail protein [Martelella alba]
MADIAVIFHWSPSELYSLSLTELITWRGEWPNCMYILLKFGGPCWT